MYALRKILAVALCLAVLVSGVPYVNAAPRYSNINLIAVSFGIKSDGQVIIESTVDARNCTAVEQRAELQQWTGSRWESLPGSKTVVNQNTWCWLQDTGWYVSSGRYRAMIYITIYNGNQIVEQTQEPSVEAVR